MKSDKKPMFEPKKKNIAVIVALLVVALVAVLYAVLIYIVMPYVDNFFTLELPSRRANSAHYLNTAEATTLAVYALAAAAGTALFIGILTSAKKHSVAIGIAYLLVMAGSFYSMIIVGNIFWNVWNGWWAILGHIIGFVLGLSILYLLIANTTTNSDPKPKKK